VRRKVEGSKKRPPNPNNFTDRLNLLEKGKRLSVGGTLKLVITIIVFRRVSPSRVFIQPEKEGEGGKTGKAMISLGRGALATTTQGGKILKKPQSIIVSLPSM